MDSPDGLRLLPCQTQSELISLPFLPYGLFSDMLESLAPLPVLEDPLRKLGDLPKATHAQGDGRRSRAQLEGARLYDNHRNGSSASRSGLEDLPFSRKIAAETDTIDKAQDDTPPARGARFVGRAERLRLSLLSLLVYWRAAAGDGTTST